MNSARGPNGLSSRGPTEYTRTRRDLGNKGTWGVCFGLSLENMIVETRTEQGIGGGGSGRPAPGVLMVPLPEEADDDFAMDNDFRITNSGK